MFSSEKLRENKIGIIIASIVWISALGNLVYTLSKERFSANLFFNIIDLIFIVGIPIWLFVRLKTRETMNSNYLSNPLDLDTNVDVDGTIGRLDEEDVQVNQNIRSNVFEAHEFLPDEYKAGVYKIH